MATYIVDSGSNDRDATLSGTVIPDETNKVMRFGADGQADTSTIFRDDIAWMLIEVYDVDSNAGYVGYTQWKSDVSNLASDMITARSTAIAEYTTFKITCTHYKGNERCDVYRGDESTALALASADTDSIYYPNTATSWKITDTTLAPNPEETTDGVMANNQTYWTSQYSWTYSDITNNEMTVYNNSGASIRNYAGLEAVGDDLEIGVDYDFSVECTSHTSGQFRFYCGTTASSYFSGVGTKTATITLSAHAAASDASIQFLDGCYTTLKNFSVKKAK